MCVYLFLHLSLVRISDSIQDEWQDNLGLERVTICTHVLVFIPKSVRQLM